VDSLSGTGSPPPTKRAFPDSAPVRSMMLCALTEALNRFGKVEELALVARI
jgi:hypothetical protein